jgi:hypothetical protein
MIFGKIPISPEELVVTLNRLASKKAEELKLGHSNTAWTYAVKYGLEKMAHKRHLKQLFTKGNTELAGEKISEFMLDAVWWLQSRSGNAALLGVECEWGNPWDRNCKSRADCVAVDFEKLLQFKAPMKLMIFQADNAQMRKAIHRILHKCLHAFQQHMAGETYVFIEFSNGKCFSYTCEIKRDGRDTSLKLKPMNSESELH